MRAGDEHCRQQRIKTQHRLELFDAASRVGADRVVGEADDAASGRDEVVLAQPVVGEGLAAPVVRESVELEGHDVLGATNLVVNGIVTPFNASLGLRGDASRHLGIHRWGEDPAHEGVLEEGRRRDRAPDRQTARVTHGPRRSPRRCARAVRRAGVRTGRIEHRAPQPRVPH